MKKIRCLKSTEGTWVELLGCPTFRLFGYTSVILEIEGGKIVEPTSKPMTEDEE